MVTISEVTTDIKRIEAWLEVNTVDRFLIQQTNIDATHNSTYSVNTVMDINLSGVNVIDGWVDNAHPEMRQTKGTATQVIEVIGRDYSRELVDLTLDKTYGLNTAGNLQDGTVIVDDMLSTAGSSITYSAPGSTTAMFFDSKDDTLYDNFRDILNDRLNYDFYVDAAKALQTFAVGTNTAAVTLTDVPGSSNILDFQWDAEDGLGIKNYIIVKGKDVDDGWSELNAGDWKAPTNGTVTDNSTATVGVSSLKFTKSTATASWIDLDFTNSNASNWDAGASTLYGRSSVDLSKVAKGDLAFSIMQSTYDSSTLYMYVRLKDTSNNEIEWRRNRGSWPDGFESNGVWVNESLPIGNTVTGGIETTDDIDRAWFYVSTATAFTWNVKNIRIGYVTVGGGAVDEFQVDGLKLPTKMYTVKQDSTSQSNYGVRHKPFTKLNFDTQIEIENWGADFLARNKDILKFAKVTVPGSTCAVGGNNVLLPGKTITLNVTKESISSESWRIVQAHHVWDTDTAFKGYQHFIELLLIPNTQKLDMRRYEALYKKAGKLREIREIIKWLENKEDSKESPYPPPPAPVGDLYPVFAHEWQKRWEAENPPITLKTGTSTVSDATASNNRSIQRVAADASADMWDSEDIWPDFGGATGDGGPSDYWFHHRMKVASNASTATILTLAIFDSTGSANLGTFDISPSLFTGGNDVWHLMSVKARLAGGYPIKLRGDDFVTGITDLDLDWIAVGLGSVGYGTQSTSVNVHTGTDTNAHSNASNVNESTHTHNLIGTTGNPTAASGEVYGQVPVTLDSINVDSGFMPTGVSTYYVASTSGGATTVAIDLPTGYQSRSTWNYGNNGDYVIDTFDADEYIQTRGHTHDLGGKVSAAGAAHTHTQNQAANHVVTDPDAHVVTNDEHDH